MNLKSLFAVAVTFFLPAMLLAGVVNTNSPLYVSWIPVYPDQQLDLIGTTTTVSNIQDPDLGNASATFINSNCYGMISLAINWDRNYYNSFPYSVTIPVTFNWTDVNGTINNGSCKLTVSHYNTQVTEVESQDHFVIPTALGISNVQLGQATINDITSGYPGVPAPSGFNPANVYLNVSIQSEKYLPLATPSWVFSISPVVGQGYQVNWNAIAGAEEYELEWLQIPRGDNNSTCTFKNNSSRIVTTGNSYIIPPAYTTGILVARVRAVGRYLPSTIAPNNSIAKIYSQWSLNDGYTITALPSSSYYYINSTFESKLNWNYTAAFDEHGREGENILYFDGSLRNRESMARDFSDNDIVLVSNFVFDYYGRPSASFLPSIDNTSGSTLSFAFKGKYQRPETDNTREYRWDDLLGGSFNGCTYSTIGLDNGYGAENYFSNNRTFQFNYERYLPTSQKFPLLRFNYMNDLTSTVTTSTLPGFDHQIGSGHESQFFISSPSSSKLLSLFGNQVGNVTGYTQEKHIDPNGTIYLSYKNLDGQVIATSVAGPVPASLNNTTQTPMPTFSINTTDLTTTNVTQINYDISTDCVNSIYTFGTNSSTNLLVNYSIDIPTYMDTCDIQDCFECTYDFSLSIIGVCDGGGPPQQFVPAGLQNQMGALNYTCSGTGSNMSVITDGISALNITVPGNYEYTITKNLCVDKSAALAYANEFIQNDTCLETINDFLSSDLSFLNFQNCYTNCTTCLAALGAYSQYSDSTKMNTPGYIYLTQAQYDSLQSKCNQLCTPPASVSPCQGYLSEMLSQMSPGGQYAPFALDVNGNPYIDPTTQYWALSNVPYSIFYVQGSGPAPQIIAYNDPSIAYTPSSITINGAIVDVNQLTPQQFAQNFAYYPGWGQALVQHHPEYCGYTYCIQNQGSFTYDDQIENTQTYSAALSAGYMNPVNMSSPPIPSSLNIPANTSNEDPYFVGSASHPSALSPFVLGLTNFVDGYGNPTNKDLWSLSFANANSNGLPIGSDNGWAMFKMGYINMKLALYKNDLTCLSIPSSCTTCNPVFDFSNPQQDLSQIGVTSTSPSTMTTQLQGAIIQNGQSFCSSYDSLWITSLQNCNLPAADLASLINDLNQICMNGVSQNNPAGASTSTIPSSYGDYSFVGAVTRVLKNDNIQWSQLCNPYMVDVPAPANTDPSNEMVPLDQCACDTILKTHEAYDSLLAINALPGGITDENDYFNLMLGIPFSTDLLLNCGVQTDPIDIPCDELEAVYQNYLAANGLPSNTPYFSITDMSGLTLYVANALNISIQTTDLMTLLKNCYVPVNPTGPPSCYDFEQYFITYAALQNPPLPVASPPSSGTGLNAATCSQPQFYSYLLGANLISTVDFPNVVALAVYLKNCLGAGGFTAPEEKARAIHSSTNGLTKLVNHILNEKIVLDKVRNFPSSINQNVFVDPNNKTCAPVSYTLSADVSTTTYTLIQNDSILITLNANQAFKANTVYKATLQVSNQYSYNILLSSLFVIPDSGVVSKSSTLFNKGLVVPANSSVSIPFSFSTLDSGDVALQVGYADAQNTFVIAPPQSMPIYDPNSFALSNLYINITTSCNSQFSILLHKDREYSYLPYNNFDSVLTLIPDLDPNNKGNIYDFEVILSSSGVNVPIEGHSYFPVGVLSSKAVQKATINISSPTYWDSTKAFPSDNQSMSMKAFLNLFLGYSNYQDVLLHPGLDADFAKYANAKLTLSYSVQDYSNAIQALVQEGMTTTYQADTNMLKNLSAFFGGLINQNLLMAKEVNLVKFDQLLPGDFINEYMYPDGNAKCNPELVNSIAQTIVPDPDSVNYTFNLLLYSDVNGVQYSMPVQIYKTATTLAAPTSVLMVTVHRSQVIASTFVPPVMLDSVIIDTSYFTSYSIPTSVSDTVVSFTVVSDGVNYTSGVNINPVYSSLLSTLDSAAQPPLGLDSLVSVTVTSTIDSTDSTSNLSQIITSTNGNSVPVFVKSLVQPPPNAHYNPNISLNIRDKCGFEAQIDLSKRDNTVAWEDIIQLVNVSVSTSIIANGGAADRDLFTIQATTSSGATTYLDGSSKKYAVEMVVVVPPNTGTGTGTSGTSATFVTNGTSTIMVPAGIACPYTCPNCAKIISWKDEFTSLLIADNETSLLQPDSIAAFDVVFTDYISVQHNFVVTTDALTDFMNQCVASEVTTSTPNITNIANILPGLNNNFIKWGGSIPIPIINLNVSTPTPLPTKSPYLNVPLTSFDAQTVNGVRKLLTTAGYKNDPTACKMTVSEILYQLPGTQQALTYEFADKCGNAYTLEIGGPDSTFAIAGFSSIAPPYTVVKQNLPGGVISTRSMAQAIYTNGTKPAPVFVIFGPNPTVTVTYDSTLVLCPPTITPDDSCLQNMLINAMNLAQQQYQNYIVTIKQQFLQNYAQYCTKAAAGAETYNLSYNDPEYQFTLYYYDRTGTLVKTIPPAGVNPTNTTGIPNPANTMATIYHYNSLDQIISQQGPDVDAPTLYFYDQYSRVIASQSGRQSVSDAYGNIRYSYLVYDAFGRLAEVGQLSVNNAYPLTQAIASDPAIYPFWFAGGTKSEITRSYYDLPKWQIPNFTQNNLRNRIASVTFAQNDNNEHYDNATHYSYDLEGNLAHVIQEFPGLDGLGRRYLTIDYSYDLVSGNMDTVRYQAGQPDQLTQLYSYDLDNQLQEVQSSSDGVIFFKDVSYSYYPTGPILREELGNLQVQGLDHYYTIHGWIKGLNSISLNPANDIGVNGIGDGASIPSPPDPRAYSAPRVAADAFGYSLGYYTYNYGGGLQLETDYKPTDPTVTVEPQPGSADYLTKVFAYPLYNGNMSRLSTAQLTPASNWQTSPMQYAMNTIANFYQYDFLNRIAAKTSVQDAATDMYLNNSWGSLTAIHDYDEAYQYDANGNINGLMRNGFTVGGSPLAMNNMTYKYDVGRNRLRYVTDPTPPSNYSVAIHSQNPNNYSYDADGNLIGDVWGGISKISWTSYGKVQTINQNNATLTYLYNGAGLRVMKENYSSIACSSSNLCGTRTYYAYEPGGNILGVYTLSGSGSMTNLSLSERYLYGMSRVGVLDKTLLINSIAGIPPDYPSDPSVTNINYPLYSSGTTSGSSSILPPYDLPQLYGDRKYELHDHLDNVHTTISDIKIPVPLTSSGNWVDHYQPDIIISNDFYSGGMAMVGRNFNSTNYRFGASGGQEVDNEVYGPGNAYVAQFWQYDPRLMRRWDVDPFGYIAPWNSPYATNFNNPIIFADEIGDIPWWKLVAGYTSKSKLKPPVAARLQPKLKVIRPHHGVDMPDPEGTDIHAAASGKVVLNQWVEGYGWCVVIDHGKGFYTLYGHMKSQSDAKGHVKNNQVIGHVGQTGGVSTGNHLHIEYMHDPKNRHIYFSSKNFDKSKIIFNPMTILDLQNVVDGSEKATINYLAGGSDIVNTAASSTSTNEQKGESISDISAEMHTMLKRFDFKMDLLDVMIRSVKFKPNPLNTGSSTNTNNSTGGSKGGAQAVGNGGCEDENESCPEVDPGGCDGESGGGGGSGSDNCDSGGGDCD